MTNTRRKLFEYIRFVARRIGEDRCAMVAGSLTYTSLLALVPVFAVTLTLTARMPMVRDFIFQVKSFILKNFLPDVAGRMVGVYMEQFAQNAARLTVIGLIIILATAIALLFTIDNAVNAIWRTKQHRRWWKKLAAYLALLTIGPLLIGASLSMTSYLVHWSSQFDRVLPMLDDSLLRVVPFALTALALILAYRIVPNRYVPTRHAVIGGVFAAVLFELVKHLFVAYIVRVPTYSLVYGAFASIPIFLVWLYCCWMVALIGAEVTATLSYFGHVPSVHHVAAKLQRAPAARLRDATQIIDTLAQSPSPLAFNLLRQQAGGGETSIAMPIDIVEDVLHDLLAARIVTEVAAMHYQLTMAREDIRDADIRAAVGIDE
ncbi:MAG: YihY family inner membrane protein [Usitatibacteraceae bacterium]